LSFSSSIIDEEEENVKKLRRFMRNLMKGIWVILLDSSIIGEVAAIIGGMKSLEQGKGKDRVLFAPTQGFLFKPQLGYLT
jgi:hypothetical protein